MKRDLEAYHASIGPRGFLLHDALRAVWLTIARANEYVDRQAPWKLAKDPATPCRAGEHARDTDETAHAAGGVPLALHAQQGGGALESAWRARLSGRDEIQRPHKPQPPPGWKCGQRPVAFPKKEAECRKGSPNRKGALAICIDFYGIGLPRVSPSGVVETTCWRYYPDRSCS